MEKSREFFIGYLREIGLYSAEVERLFDNYFYELVLANSQINLFSRAMDTSEIWVRHFLDSVSSFEVFKDWSGLRVLDFGTGGGLPGLPIKIVCSDCHMTFLDSTSKKIVMLKKIVESLRIESVSFIAGRIEELDSFVPHKQGRHVDLPLLDGFDVIVCRAVKIVPAVQKALLRALKKNGKILLYKGVSYDDVKLFKDYTIHNIDKKILGERKIIEIKYG